MPSQRNCRKSFGKLMHSVIAAGLVFGMTGFASAQSCTDTKDCFNKKGLKRTEVMKASTTLRDCLRNNKKVPAYERSTVPNSYLELIKERDATEKQQLKQAGSNMEKLKAVHSSGLAAYTAAAADAQQKIQFYKCGSAPAKR